MNNEKPPVELKTEQEPGTIGNQEIGLGNIAIALARQQITGNKQ
jgi:hypothetical protein